MQACRIVPGDRKTVRSILICRLSPKTSRVCDLTHQCGRRLRIGTLPGNIYIMQIEKSIAGTSNKNNLRGLAPRGLRADCFWRASISPLYRILFPAYAGLPSGLTSLHPQE